MSNRRTRTLVLFLATLLLVSVAPVRVLADTQTDLQAARSRLIALQGELNRLAGRYDAAQSSFAQTQSQIDATRARLARVRSHMGVIQKQLSLRARLAYETGGAGGTLELLLSSSSFDEFSNRIEYLGRIAQGDTDLMNQASVTREQLRRSRADLVALSARQAGTIRSLASTKAAIAQKFTQQQTELASLRERFRREQVAAARAAAQAAAARVARQPGGGSGSGGLSGGGSGGGSLQACPVGQPRAFGDDFGDPRPGGRTHQGIDLLAPLGTPVYAAQAGTFQQNFNSLGGISAIVTAPNGDYTYYAHMSAYAGIPNGGSVSAGTQIGHVGNTGDAQGGPYHLHFEYHPGGGGAVDPYQLLVSVCG